MDASRRDFLRRSPLLVTTSMPKPRKATTAAIAIVAVSADGLTLTVALDGRARPGMKIANWFLAWGDGEDEASAGVPPLQRAHTFTPGDYLLRLTVWDTGGSFAEATVIASIRAVPVPTAPSAPSSPVPGALLTPSGLTYLGAFNVPDGIFGTSRFGHGDASLAHRPDTNTLFVSGHAALDGKSWAEISIPDLVNSNNLFDLHMATVIQNFADPTEGKWAQINGIDYDTVTGALLIDGPTMIASGYLFYDAQSTAYASHWRRTSLSLTARDVTSDAGAITASGMPVAATAQAMGWIPEEYRASLGGHSAIAGGGNLSIISRSSYGPSLAAFTPSHIGPAGATGLKMLHYPDEARIIPGGTLTRGVTSAVWNRTSMIMGVVWPTQTRSVLFWGRHGTGSYEYGLGTNDPALHGVFDPGQNEYYWYDPDYPDTKGEHAWPYVARVWAYDANDLIAVAAGTKNSWEVAPYGVWDLEVPFFHLSPIIGGAAFDQATRRIYASTARSNRVAPADSEPRPVIHAYQVA
jgi:hypothetical protein